MIKEFVKLIMTKKEKFVEEMHAYFNDFCIQLSPEAHEYWMELIQNKSSIEGITENGMKILSFMKENEKQYNNFFSAMTIAEGLFVPSRAVSGAMRKLVTDGYVEKTGKNPVSYSLTETARSCQI